jgi:hypothetical protein
MTEQQWLASTNPDRVPQQQAEAKAWAIRHTCGAPRSPMRSILSEI